jgi:competence protein ComEC
MFNKTYKFFLILAILFLMATPVAGLVWPTEKNLKVYFLDVGQGDSILIRAPSGQNILIDGGPNNLVLEHLNNILPFWDRTIDLMILTHPHADHVTGLVEVSRRYRVKRALYTGVVHTLPAYLEWLKELKTQKIPTTIIDHAQTIYLTPDCQLKILYPLKSLAGQTAVNLNNTSIVAKLTYKQVSFLFTGDIEAEAEDELLAQDQSLRAQVLKVPHHGSHTSSQPEFIQAVKPQFAVIEVGEKNEFGQPSRRIIKRYQTIGTKVYRTDKDRTIIFVTDGQKIKVQRELSKK